LSNGDQSSPLGVSPTSTGPAGSHFEAQVGASYLLALLTGGEPRGLPGTIIDRVALQRAAEGRPLDDIIVHAHDARGIQAVLEIQVKRELTFAPSDEVFGNVVGQIAAAARRSEFWTSRYELAIATAKISRKIAGPYQEVLAWARHLGSAATFIDRIHRPGSSNDDMRSFVRAFTNRLREAGSPHDDETVWRLLGRLQILVFDFTARGSADEALVRERAAQALHADDASHAGELWTILVELALRVAVSGGDRTRAQLVEELQQQAFRLAGDRRHAATRVRLAEASENALADIGDVVAGVTLSRHERLEQIRAALDSGRYIEIRGDSGVGKSALLKNLARQIATESRVMVLSPGRTPTRGWLEMRAVLGFDGTARDLLVDLAGTGGAILFIDNLDRFAADERLTVIDLVRAAADVPGVAVVATARTNFDVDEPNWLPGDGLDRLGRAKPVMVDELSESEIAELRHSAPRLVPLLADNHPARPVARNLFRLARLAAHTDREESTRTEVQMAQQWWRTADGALDATHRERSRVLRALGEGVLAQSEPLDVRDLSSAAIDSLIRTETLRDLGSDRVAFRHDVLAEWALGCLLWSDTAAFDRLPLGRPAPATLARGVELAARSAVELVADSTQWQSLLERLSRDGIHGSWRRAVLLALVRSEAATDVLTKARVLLLADHGHLLRELIRVVKAVEVMPAADLFAAAGVDPAIIPRHLNAPRGPSWFRLIMWLLQLGEDLPSPAIPDVVDLYTDWSLGGLGIDPLTPRLLPWLHRWLTEIEEARNTENVWRERAPFGGDLGGANLRDLETNLRTAFVSFCNRVPALAAEYLQSLMGRRRNEEAVKAILKFRGQLAQAAPAELAELTARALIPQREEDRRGVSRGGDPFTWTDSEFIPASPSQGPFLELLMHAPVHGLSLIRRLVDHAIAFHSGGRPHGSNAFVLQFPDRARTFAWTQSYGWSRGWGRSFAVGSALMALEAWAHKRLEAGERFENVLDDVLGADGAPAAYLLVAVDLLLSHWPASRETAVPFLACPELLCIDRERWSHDVTPIPAALRLAEPPREPRGAVMLTTLETRPSRRAMLDELLTNYVFDASEEVRQRLAAFLRDAVARLGPYSDDADLRDPAFMAVHATNLVDVNNYMDVQVPLRDGRVVPGRQYVPPEAERLQMERLQLARSDRSMAVNIQLAISAAVEDRERSSPDFVERAVEWAQVATRPPSDDEDDGSAEMHDRAIVGAAMLAMRDGTPEVRDRHRPWADGVFADTLGADDDPVHRVRDGLKFNPMAIAFAGMAYALEGLLTADRVRTLLAIAERPAAAHGFIAAAPTVARIDERLPRAILRCAFVACIRATRRWDEPEDERVARKEAHRRAFEAAVAAELAWLFDGGDEPIWPAPPIARPRTRRRPRVGVTVDSDRTNAGTEAALDRFDYQAAALWLRGASALLSTSGASWIEAVVRSYADWTWTANGAGLEATDDLSQKPHEWNDVYLALLARNLIGASEATVERVALSPLASLPDESFCDALTRFQRFIDEVYFGNGHLEPQIAAYIRSRLAERLRASNGWTWFVRRRSESIEMHLGPAIATLFFNDYSFVQPAKAYLLPPGIDRLMPFLPTLETLAMEGASHFVAVVTLNLLEVSPRAAHLPLLLRVAGAWIAAFPNSTQFWIDYSIGTRVCALIEAAWREEPRLLGVNEPLREDLNRLLPALIRLGVAEAARLEQALMESDESR
jgi:energy-coupling factor transporter ATP-binding protein EcfA2